MLKDRKIIIQGIFILVGLVFVIRLFFIQVLDSNYKFEAQNNVMRRIIEYPYRGLIYDRNGKLLVYNTPVFDLMVVMKEVDIKDTLTFCDQFGLTKKEFIANIKKIKQAREYSSVKPIAFIKQLSITDYAKIQDFLVDYKGFYIQARTIRSYPLPSLANALGYIGEISKRQLESQENKYYSQGDYVGISGLESTYEKELRGKRGARYVMVNVRGVEKGAFKNGIYDTVSVPGENLYSSIDLDLQAYGEKLMENKIGSVVAIEPSTGEILAFISSPTYDPNLLAGRKFSENYNKLSRDSLKPLFNRPLMAMYPPGSIFKLVQALVAEEMGVLGPNTRYVCSGANAMGVKCHPHPSPQDLRGAIQYSCNPYFVINFKEMLNIDKHPNKFINTEINYDAWRRAMLDFGFGKRMAVDLPNAKSGNIPSNKYYDKIYGDLHWKFSTIYSLGIGQGEVLVTPIQMANMAAVIANRGFYNTPHLVKGIGNDKQIPAEFLKKHDAGVNPKHFPAVIDGMQAVMEAGTARYYGYVQGIDICGKTGTAQNPHGEDHAAFIAFAPKVNPKIAIAAYVENAGFGGSWAAPIATLMIEKYLKDSTSRPKIEKYILDKDFIGRKKVVPAEVKPSKPKTTTTTQNNGHEPKVNTAAPVNKSIKEAPVSNTKKTPITNSNSSAEIKSNGSSNNVGNTTPDKEIKQ